MRKSIVLALMLMILAGLTACGDRVKSSESIIPQLLEPVGVGMDVVPAQMGDIYKAVTYQSEIVPHVEELSLSIDGTLEQIWVEVGDYVTEGQMLVSLSKEGIIERIEELDKEIEDIRIMGEFSDRQMILDIEIAKIELDQLEETGGFSQEYRLKEVDLEKLQKALEHARQLRQMELEEKQRVRKDLQEKLENTEIKAPFEGRVVYIRDIENGDSIPEYTVIMCLADESRLWLETEYIAEPIIRDVDKIYARINTKEYALEYQPCDPDEYVSKILNDEEVKTRFRVVAEDGELESGQFAVVVQMNTYRQNVLTIPVNALFQDTGSRYVYKVTGEERVKCNVTVGAIGDTKAEIIDGLKEGDMVYVKE